MSGLSPTQRSDGLIKRYAVSGASSGTGLALVKQLSAQRSVVRDNSRRPPNDEPYIKNFSNCLRQGNFYEKAVRRPLQRYP